MNHRNALFALSPIIGAVMATMSLTGCGDVQPPSDQALGTTEQAIVNGSVDTSDPSVVEFAYADSNGNIAGHCTATVIAPTTLLTAGHCLQDLNNTGTGSMALIALQDGEIPFARAISWTLVDTTHIGDFGVLILPAPLSGITPMKTLGGPATPPGFSESILVGQAVTIVGFGNDNHGSFIKRRGTASIQSMSSTAIFLLPDPSSTCNGDSGGPALTTISGNQFIVGTTSTSDCASSMLDTRVSAGASFLNPYIAATVQNMGRPFWHNNYGYSGTPVGDWANGDYKAQCDPGQAIIGLSQTGTGLAAHINSALCSSGTSSVFSQSSSCRALPFNPNNNPNPWIFSDWDPNGYKAECDFGEYVAGVSQSTSGNINGILCCPLTAFLFKPRTTVEVYANQNSNEYASPDWDFGFYKGECPVGSFVTGVSADTTFNDGHALLCNN